MVQELGSSTEGSRDPMTQTNTPKLVEEVVVKVMKVDKVVMLFQTMVIMSLNMGNFDFGVEHSKKHIGYGGEGKESVIGGIG
jgi:hypothetical protein